MGFELAQLFQVVNPTVAEARGEQVREAGIGEDHPAAGRDAVGLVGELLRSELVEIAQDVALEQLGVQRRDAVDGMAADGGQMRHAHVALAGFVDDGEAAQAVFVAGKAGANVRRGGGG